MISLQRYNLVKRQYGHCGSWAVWANEGYKPKDNVGDLNVLDPAINPAILDTVNPNIVLVGLNISRRIKKPLANFHDSKSTAADFKIRYAFRGSSFWGAYMTDIIKDFEQKASGKMINYLKQNPQFEQEIQGYFAKNYQKLAVQILLLLLLEEMPIKFLEETSVMNLKY